MKSVFLASVTALAISASMAQAANIEPAVVYDQAGKYDKSFNEGVYNGVKRYTADSNIQVREFEPKNEAQVEQGLRRLAKRGYSPIVAVGFSMTSAVEKVAKDFPDIHFSIIDGVIDLPNVQSIVFKEQEGSFLVGALAAMASKTHIVGFVGGMDIPLIRRFGCGYEQGVKYITPDAKVIQNMTGSTGAAFNDPTKGSELAKSQFSQGADVVFAAAGGTGIGVYQAAKESLFSRIHRIVQDENDVMVRVEMILTLVLGFADSNPGMCRLLTADVLAGETERLRVRIAQLFDRIETQLKQVIREADLKQGLRPAMGVAPCANFLMALLEGKIRHYVRSEFKVKASASWPEQWTILAQNLMQNR